MKKWHGLAVVALLAAVSGCAAYPTSGYYPGGYPYGGYGYESNPYGSYGYGGAPYCGPGGGMAVPVPVPVPQYGIVTPAPNPPPTVTYRRSPQGNAVTPDVRMGVQPVTPPPPMKTIPVPGGTVRPIPTPRPSNAPKMGIQPVSPVPKPAVRPTPAPRLSGTPVPSVGKRPAGLTPPASGGGRITIGSK